MNEVSVEILSVSLSPETIEQVAQRVAYLIAGGPTQAGPAPGAAQATPPAPPAPAAQNQGQGDYDPWAGTNTAPQGAAPNGQPYQQGQPSHYTPQGQQPPQQAPQAPQQGGPVCAHGPMKYVPGGFSKSTNRPYPAFWACTTPKGAPDKCGSVAA
jgi:hypothetical protein